MDSNNRGTTRPASDLTGTPIERTPPGHALALCLILNPLAVLAADSETSPLSRSAGASGTVTLPEVTVQGAAASETEAYIVPRSTAATRFEAAPIEVPQSVQTLDRALIEDSGAVDVGDLLKRVPSAYVGNTRLAPFTSFSWKIRGFDAAVTRNGFRQLYFEDVDQSALSNVERLEIIKGPGSAVFGAEGLGGTLNMVTKRPQSTFAANGQLLAGRYDDYGASFDVTGPIADDDALTVRLVGDLERSGSFVDFQDIDRDNIALSAAWDRGEGVRAFLLTEYQERRSLPNPGLPILGTVQGNGRGRPDRSTYLGEPAFDDLETSAPLVQAWLEFDLAEHWTLSPRYQYFAFNVDQQQMRLRAPLADGTISRSGRFDFQERDKTDTFQLELKGQFDTARIRHQTLFGAEYEHHRWRGDWFNYTSPPPIDPLEPTYLDAPPPIADSRTTFSGKGKTPSVYVQDLMHLTDTVTALVGVRHSAPDFTSESGKGPDDRLTSFQLGTAWEFVPDWSLFAGYGTGFTTEAVIGSTNRSGKPFEPETTAQWETGLKHQSDRASMTLALFDITRQNVTTTDPFDPDFSVQTGEQRARGIELEWLQEITTGWFVQGGLAYIDSEITRSNDGDKGNRLGNIAPWQANLWTLYRFDGQLQGLETAVGANYVDSRYGTDTNRYRLDAYTTVDASLAYWLTPKLKAELFLQNLLDEEYYTGNNNFSVYPGEPRTGYVRLKAYF